MKLRNTVGKLATLGVITSILAFGMTGAWRMWGVFRDDNIDIDLFMKALAVMMIAVVCFIPMELLLKKAKYKTKVGARAEIIRSKAITKTTGETPMEITGKLLAFKKEVGQQA